MEWPLYRSEMLVKGDPHSQIGIITLFTEKEKVLFYLSKEDFALLGQLYNPSYGTSILVRNCLANKNIRYLIICGQDLSESGEALIKLKENGVEEVLEGERLIGYRVKGLKEERMIEKEIPLAAIDLFRENVEILDYRHLMDFNELKKIIQGLEKKPSYGESEVFPEIEIKPERFPADNSVFRVKGKFVGEAWLKILETIMRFGVMKRSEYAEDQKEILNLVVTITDEDPNNIKWGEYFLFSKEHLEKYIPLVITNKKVEGVHYTYGSRLRNWRGIDQIESLIKKLKKSVYSRRAVAVTWDVEKDYDHADAPCIDLVQCLVQDDLLFMTVFIRSNDMFEGWPENALALRQLHFTVAEGVGIKMGSLTTISGSAHIYERNWKKAFEILEKHPVLINRLNDARGNFVVYIKDGLIKVEHQSSNGKVLEVVEGKTAEEISLKLTRKQKISEIYHAFYLGGELERAETALREGLDYEQEKRLDLEIKKKAAEGKFIVIDGLDGSGKATQAELLVGKLREEGCQVKMADFPQYGKWSAQFVERYLRGEFGGAKEVKAKQASLFFALDRYAASSQIRRWLDQGIIVISNRYVSANKGHQLGKLNSPEEMHEFLNWLNDVEYNILGIPVPDLTLFLHMAPEIGQRLVDKKGERDYIKGKKRDIHEEDLEHLKNAERAYLFCLEKDDKEKWKRIVCFEGNEPKTRETIHREVHQMVKEILRV